MSTSASTIDFLLDQLSDCGAVTVRKMFGEYCLYLAGQPVGLVCDDQLFLKHVPTAPALSPELGMGSPYPRAKPHWCITADHWDDRQRLCQWVRQTALSLPVTPPKPPRARAKSGVDRA